MLAATRKHSPESAAALEAICRAYWHPLYAFARRSGQSPQDAQDLTQEFFARLLQKRWLETADREKGRLRTFLIAAMKNFMRKQWRRESEQKRGGGRADTALDTEIAESRYAADAPAKLAPDEVFDRQWALTLLELTLRRLQAEFAVGGRARDFEILKGCLMARHGAIDYAAMAEPLGVNAGAARVAVHRLRKRFREVFRATVAETVSSPEEVEAELRHLVGLLGES